jgi:hypothetical protein
MTKYMKFLLDRGLSWLVGKERDFSEKVSLLERKHVLQFE